jgi:hypothetical protein
MASVGVVHPAPEVQMNRSGVNGPRDIARSAEVEPFNGCHEMFPITEFYDATRPHGPSQAILTARVATDSIFTCTIKIPLLSER